MIEIILFSYLAFALLVAVVYAILYLKSFNNVYGKYNFTRSNKVFIFFVSVVIATLFAPVTLFQVIKNKGNVFSNVKGL